MVNIIPVKVYVSCETSPSQTSRVVLRNSQDTCVVREVSEKQRDINALYLH
jgi:hypothetical protein